MALFKRVTRKGDGIIALFKRVTRKGDDTIALFKRVTKNCKRKIALFNPIPPDFWTQKSHTFSTGYCFKSCLVKKI